MKSKFLNVISIILIILGVMGIISSIASFVAAPAANAALVEAGMDALPAWYSIVSLINAVVELAAGVIGVMYKSKDMVKMAGIVYLVVTIVAFAINVFVTPAALAGITVIIFPILYLVGWKKSN